MKVQRKRGRKTRTATLSRLDRAHLVEALTRAIEKSPPALPRAEWVEPEDCEHAAQMRAWARLRRALLK